MNQKEFRALFEAALDQAAENAEAQLGVAIPRTFQIELHGAGHPGDILDVSDTVDSLYLGEDVFYRIIDVAVQEVGPQKTKVFVRASSHTPSSFEDTWNQPPGSGPFKQLISAQIKTTSKALDALRQAGYEIDA